MVAHVVWKKNALTIRSIARNFLCFIAQLLNQRTRMQKVVISNHAFRHYIKLAQLLRSVLLFQCTICYKTQNYLHHHCYFKHHACFKLSAQQGQSFLKTKVFMPLLRSEPDNVRRNELKTKACSKKRELNKGEKKDQTRHAKLTLSPPAVKTQLVPQCQAFQRLVRSSHTLVNRTFDLLNRFSISLWCFWKHWMLFASVCNINTPGQ
jgi:hypothetical protein